VITRSEQKALFDSLTGDLTINTKPDGSGTDIIIPVDVHWGFEPKEIENPTIVLKFIVKRNPIERTLGDLWKNTDEGEFDGFIAEDTLLVKIFATDYQVGGNISKIDIAADLEKRVFFQAFQHWDSLIDEGSVVEGGISATNNVSEILGLEEMEILQFTIRLKKLYGGVPVETGLLFSTAPTLLEVETEVSHQ